MRSCRRKTEWAAGKSKRTRLKNSCVLQERDILSPAGTWQIFFQISAAVLAANCICTQVTRPEGVGGSF